MDVARRCENQSWATVQAMATTERHGNDVALVVARVAYEVTPNGHVTLTYRPVRWSETSDGRGGIKFPSDVATEKPGTDVGLVGSAHPQRGKRAPNEPVLAWVTAGPLRKAIQLTGARKYGSSWGKIAPGAPEPLERLPLSYDLCFGGVERPEDGFAKYAEESSNLIGRGFATDETKLLGRPAPQLEPVNDPLSPPAHRSHGCFAPLPASWEPRRLLIGTLDEDWHKLRAPTPPKNLDAKFHCWAPPELHSDKPLIGDEPIEVGGVLAEGTWRFALPRYQPIFGTKVSKDEWHRYPTHLDGILIDADEHVVELTWRAVIPLPTPWEKLPPIRVWSDTPMPREFVADRTPDPAKVAAAT